MLTIVVVNDGETTEYVAAVRLEPVGRRASYDLSRTLKSDHELKPRERLPIAFSAKEVGFDLEAGFIGVARLASGREVPSPLEHLHDELLSQIAEHNRYARP